MEKSPAKVFKRVSQISFVLAFLFFLFVLTLMILRSRKDIFRFMTSHAEKLESRQDFHHAQRIWKKVVNSNPNLAFPHYRLANILFFKENYLEAFSYIDQVEKKFTKDSLIHLLNLKVKIAVFLNDDSLKNAVLSSVNKIFGFSVHYSNSLNRWYSTDKKFSENQLRDWAYIMEPWTGGKKVVIDYFGTIDSAARIYYFTGRYSYLPEEMITREEFNFEALNPKSKIQPKDFYPIFQGQEFPFVWYSVITNKTQNYFWLQELEKQISQLTDNQLTEFFINQKIIRLKSYHFYDYEIGEEVFELPEKIRNMLFRKIIGSTKDKKYEYLQFFANSLKNRIK